MMYTIDYNSYRSVRSFNRRVRFIVLHYTAGNFEGTVNRLAGEDTVSAHYLIPDPEEESYIKAGFKGLHIFNLVDENERAWHAGVSSWSNRSNLNDTSIGIEIVNLATDDGKGHFTFPPYNRKQIEAVRQLVQNILQRYPDISPTNIVGHSDIAVGRKSDPGPAFPWKKLYKAGIGAWYDEATRLRYRKKHRICFPDRNEILQKLQQYGYDTGAAQTDDGYRELVRAFQLHFRPKKYDGVADPETVSILYALVKKYFSHNRKIHCHTGA